MFGRIRAPFQLTVGVFRGAVDAAAEVLLLGRLLVLLPLVRLDAAHEREGVRLDAEERVAQDRGRRRGAGEVDEPALVLRERGGGVDGDDGARALVERLGAADGAALVLEEDGERDDEEDDPEEDAPEGVAEAAAPALVDGFGVGHGE